MSAEGTDVEAPARSGGDDNNGIDNDVDHDADIADNSSTSTTNNHINSANSNINISRTTLDHSGTTVEGDDSNMSSSAITSRTIGIGTDGNNRTIDSGETNYANMSMQSVSEQQLLSEGQQQEQAPFPGTGGTVQTLSKQTLVDGNQSESGGSYISSEIVPSSNSSNGNYYSEDNDNNTIHAIGNATSDLNFRQGRADNDGNRSYSNVATSTRSGDQLHLDEANVPIVPASPTLPQNLYHNSASDSVVDNMIPRHENTNIPNDEISNESEGTRSSTSNIIVNTSSTSTSADSGSNSALVTTANNSIDNAPGELDEEALLNFLQKNDSCDERVIIMNYSERVALAGSNWAKPYQRRMMILLTLNHLLAGAWALLHTFLVLRPREVFRVDVENPFESPERVPYNEMRCNTKYELLGARSSSGAPVGTSAGLVADQENIVNLDSIAQNPQPMVGKVYKYKFINKNYSITTSFDLACRHLDTTPTTHEEDKLHELEEEEVNSKNNNGGSAPNEDDIASSPRDTAMNTARITGASTISDTALYKNRGATSGASVTVLDSDDAVDGIVPEEEEQPMREQESKRTDTNGVIGNQGVHTNINNNINDSTNPMILHPGRANIGSNREQSSEFRSKSSTSSITKFRNDNNSIDISNSYVNSDIRDNDASSSFSNTIRDDENSSNSFGPVNNENDNSEGVKNSCSKKKSVGNDDGRGEPSSSKSRTIIDEASESGSAILSTFEFLWNFLELWNGADHISNHNINSPGLSTNYMNKLYSDLREKGSSTIGDSTKGDSISSSNDGSIIGSSVVPDVQTSHSHTSDEQIIEVIQPLAHKQRALKQKALQQQGNYAEPILKPTTTDQNSDIMVPEEVIISPTGNIVIGPAIAIDSEQLAAGTDNADIFNDVSNDINSDINLALSRPDRDIIRTKNSGRAFDSDISTSSTNTPSTSSNTIIIGDGTPRGEIKIKVPESKIAKSGSSILNNPPAAMPIGTSPPTPQQQQLPSNSEFKLLPSNRGKQQANNNSNTMKNSNQKSHRSADISNNNNSLAKLMISSTANSNSQSSEKLVNLHKNTLNKHKEFHDDILLKMNINREKHVGILGFLWFLGFMFGILLLIPFSDRIGRKKAFNIAMTIHLFGSTAMPFATSFRIVAFSRLVIGVGSGSCLSCGSIMVIEFFQKSDIRDRAANLIHACYGVGGMLLCYLAFQTMNWRYLCGILTCCTYVIFFCIHYGVRESPKWLLTKGHLLQLEAVLDAIEKEAALEEALEEADEYSPDDYFFAQRANPEDYSPDSNPNFAVRVAPEDTIVPIGTTRWDVAARVRFMDDLYYGTGAAINHSSAPNTSRFYHDHFSDNYNYQNPSLSRRSSNPLGNIATTDSGTQTSTEDFKQLRKRMEGRVIGGGGGGSESAIMDVPGHAADLLRKNNKSHSSPSPMTIEHSPRINWIGNNLSNYNLVDVNPDTTLQSSSGSRKNNRLGSNSNVAQNEDRFAQQQQQQLAPSPIVTTATIGTAMLQNIPTSQGGVLFSGELAADNYYRAGNKNKKSSRRNLEKFQQQLQRSQKGFLERLISPEPSRGPSARTSAVCTPKNISITNRNNNDIVFRRSIALPGDDSLPRDSFTLGNSASISSSKRHRRNRRDKIVIGDPVVVDNSDRSHIYGQQQQPQEVFLATHREDGVTVNNPDYNSNDQGSHLNAAKGDLNNSIVTDYYSNYNNYNNTVTSATTANTTPTSRTATLNNIISRRSSANLSQYNNQYYYFKVPRESDFLRLWCHSRLGRYIVVLCCMWYTVSLSYFGLNFSAENISASLSEDLPNKKGASSSISSAKGSSNASKSGNSSGSSSRGTDNIIRKDYIQNFSNFGGSYASALTGFYPDSSRRLVLHHTVRESRRNNVSGSNAIDRQQSNAYSRSNSIDRATTSAALDQGRSTYISGKYDPSENLDKNSNSSNSKTSSRKSTTNSGSSSTSNGSSKKSTGSGTGSFRLNVYIVAALTAAADIPACFVAVLFMEHPFFGRRRSMAFLLLLNCCACLVCAGLMRSRLVGVTTYNHLYDPIVTVPEGRQEGAAAVSHHGNIAHNNNININNGPAVSSASVIGSSSVAGSDGTNSGNSNGGKSSYYNYYYIDDSGLASADSINIINSSHGSSSVFSTSPGIMASNSAIEDNGGIQHSVIEDSGAIDDAGHSITHNHDSMSYYISANSTTNFGNIIPGSFLEMASASNALVTNTSNLVKITTPDKDRDRDENNISIRKRPDHNDKSTITTTTRHTIQPIESFSIDEIIDLQNFSNSLENYELIIDLGIVFSALLGKFAVSAAFAIIYTFGTEMFPTEVRATALGSQDSVARLGGMFAAFVVGLDKISRIPAFSLMIFALFSAVSSVLCELFLPETLDKKLTDRISDFEEIIDKHNNSGGVEVGGEYSIQTIRGRRIRVSAEL